MTIKYAILNKNAETWIIICTPGCQIIYIYNIGKNINYVTAVLQIITFLRSYYFLIMVRPCHRDALAILQWKTSSYLVKNFCRYFHQVWWSSYTKNNEAFNENTKYIIWVKGVNKIIYSYHFPSRYFLWEKHILLEWTNWDIDIIEQEFQVISSIPIYCCLQATVIYKGIPSSSGNQIL